MAQRKDLLDTLRRVDDAIRALDPDALSKERFVPTQRDILGKLANYRDGMTASELFGLFQTEGYGAKTPITITRILKHAVDAGKVIVMGESSGATIYGLPARPSNAGPKAPRGVTRAKILALFAPGSKILRSDLHRTLVANGINMSPTGEHYQVGRLISSGDLKVVSDETGHTFISRPG